MEQRRQQMHSGGLSAVIRPYEARDRSAVRRICFETGYMGEREWQWRDPESYADLFTSYYTDAEPESALVVERDGNVEGYLLGCLDSKRAWNEAKIFSRLFWRRGIAVRPSTARWVWRALFDSVRDSGGVGRTQADLVRDPRWPAHLHIDLLPSVRGQGLGGTLLRTWQERLRAAGVPGCHLQTLFENDRAVAAFRSVGFETLGDAVLAPGLRTRTGGRHHVQLLVWLADDVVASNGDAN